MSAYTTLCRALDGAHPIASEPRPSERHDWAGDVLDMRVMEAREVLEHLRDDPATDPRRIPGLLLAIRTLRNLDSREA